MTIIDLLSNACQSLWVRKLRTLLNLVGIVISCVLLLTTLAAASGLQQAITRFFEQADEALRFRIMPGYDVNIEPPEEVIAVSEEMSERRKERIQQLLKRKWQQENLPRPRVIDFTQMREIAAINHVVDVEPTMQFHCVTDFLGQSTNTLLAGVSYFDRTIQSRIVFGSPLSVDIPNGILMHEELAYELGIRSDRDFEQIIGKKLKIQIRQTKDLFAVFGDDFYRQSSGDQAKLLDVIDQLISGKGIEAIDGDSLRIAQNFSKARADRRSASPTLAKGDALECEFNLVGIYRDPDEDDATSFLTQFFGGSAKLIVHYSQLKPISLKMGERGTSSANVFIDHVGNLTEVSENVRKHSVSPISPARTVQILFDAIERSKHSVLIVVVIILVVSTVGIANTMLISLIERSEEIGILKAVGASNRHITWMILFEGILTGFMGGITSVFLTYLVTNLGNGILLAYVEQRVNVDLEGQVFSIEPWMITITMLVAMLVSTVAGIWPARKAARLDPIVAMGRL